MVMKDDALESLKGILWYTEAAAAVDGGFALVAKRALLRDVVIARRAQARLRLARCISEHPGVAQVWQSSGRRLTEPLLAIAGSPLDAFIRVGPDGGGWTDTEFEAFGVLADFVRGRSTECRRDAVQLLSEAQLKLFDRTLRAAQPLYERIPGEWLGTRLMAAGRALSGDPYSYARRDVVLSSPGSVTDWLLTFI